MHRATKRTCLIVLAAIAVWGGMLNMPVAAQVNVEVEAISGEPFGVGRMAVALPKEILPEPLGADGLGLSEKNGRVLYPAFDIPSFLAVARDVLDETPLLNQGPVRREVRGILRGLLDQPPRATIYFLFRGDAPLELTFQARTSFAAAAVPHADPVKHRLLLTAWWKQYTAPAKLLAKKPEYPPLVENYLKATLARRLNLQLPPRDQTGAPKDLLKEELGLLLGGESIRLAMEQDRLLGLHNLALPADQPLPAPINPPPLEIPEPPANVAVEPLALRVPAECFYIRFGSFSNFLWMQDTLATWDGDLQNLMAARGLNYGMTRRIEKQLVLKTSALARMFGESVVADVALIGTDTFFREGAAYGMLFQARNNLGLTADITSQRLERMTAGGVSEQKIKIGKHEVSYLASPDGSVRSYYANDGDYHFVATSKALVERFFASVEGTGALGASKEFRHAREIMPLDRQDAVWIYFSDAFFRNLTSPAYRLEMIRRLQAQADIEAVQLAVLAAAAEGKPGGSIENLIAGGLLPPDFGPRPDGSRTLLEGDNVRDSLRGWRGALLPVPDVPVGNATRAEVSEYGKFAEFYRQKWGRMDPTMVAIKRQAVEGNREQVVIDARLSPFAASHFEFLSKWAGPADNVQIAPVPGDIARLDLVLRDQHVFAGLRDVGLPPELAASRLLPIGRLREMLVGYIGTTGELGLLNFLASPLVMRDPRDGVEVRLGIASQKTDQFTVFSLQPEVLATVVPQLHFQQAREPAQVRLWVGDVAQARITPFLNDWSFNRTHETALGNIRLMHALDQQLHVPPQDCREAAEFLLDAKLICPLRGDYVYRQPPQEVGHWTSTVLESSGNNRGTLGQHAPPGYMAPPLNWLRGLQADATMTEKILSAHAEVLMQLPPKKEAAGTK